MKLPEAISRYRFQVSSGNKPNEKDIEAFNCIAQYLQEVQEKTIQDNLPFAKLYTYVLGKLTPHYESVDQANKHLNRILSEPMPSLVHTLEMELRSMELRSVIPDPLLSEMSPEKTRLKLAQYPTIEADFVAAWDYWDTDNTRSHLELNINLSLQKFKNDKDIRTDTDQHKGG